MTDVRNVSFITHILPALQTSFHQFFSSVTQTHSLAQWSSSPQRRAVSYFFIEVSEK
jgi:hypothetical protein